MKWIERSIWIVLVVVLAIGVFATSVFARFYHESVGIGMVNDVGSKTRVLLLMESGEIEAAEELLRESVITNGRLMDQMADHYSYGRPDGRGHDYYRKTTERLEALDLPAFEDYKYTPVTPKDAP